MLHVGARYYDAQVGRFTTRDSYLSEHPYVYCDGDPVNYTDPSGHDPDDQQGGGGQAGNNQNPPVKIKEIVWDLGFIEIVWDPVKPWLPTIKIKPEKPIKKIIRYLKDKPIRWLREHVK